MAPVLLCVVCLQPSEDPLCPSCLAKRQPRRIMPPLAGGVMGIIELAATSRGVVSVVHHPDGHREVKRWG